jgi:hypothetical protein
VSLLKMMFGALVAAVAMFVAGFLLFATPISGLAFASLDDTRSAAVQANLAQNLPATGTYVVPDPGTQAGTIGYAKGPVAIVHYNARGYSMADTDAILWGFIHEFLICFVLGWALMGIDRRVPDYISRLKTVLLFAVAGSGLAFLGMPIWDHVDWRWALYNFVGNAIMLTLAGGILARWFLPVKAEMP